MKRIISAILTLGACLTGVAQSVYPGQFNGKIDASRHGPAECFELTDVKLLPSRFRRNMERDSAWMVNISVDRLLHSFYNNSGVWGGKEGGYMTIKKYGGWESLDCELRGHTTGHLMSAYAQMYASTGAGIFKAKGDSIIDGLEKVQNALGNGYLSAFPEELINRNIRGEGVWAPWYTLHKILSGLIDQYLTAGNQKALMLAINMGDWAYNKINGIDEETRRKMLRNEFGGINEAFYNLYAITGDSKYKDAAEFFYHNEVIDPLKDKNTDFGTKHTNTFIPKVLGEMRRYELTGEQESLDVGRFFWDEMLGRHIFSPGCLSDKEHFFPTDKFSEHISGYTGETCCTYNMLKLGKHLFCAVPRSKIFDYYERALYNHILGQQDPETGMVAYFLPLKSGTHKVYSTPENSFWCCVGSGFENHSKYTESIYFKGSDGNTLYVNLFIPSELDWREKGMKLKQENNFPAEASTRLTVESAAPVSSVVKLRNPSWAKGLTVKVNGKRIKTATDSDGYIAINRKWKSGDIVDVDFDMELQVEHPADNMQTGALVYGPVVLAGRLGTEGMEGCAPDSDPSLYNDYYTYDYKIPEGLPTTLEPRNLQQTGPLTWETPEGVKVEPLYDIHRERYVVYWNLK